MVASSLEKPSEKPSVQINSIDELKRELNLELTKKEQESLQVDFKPFELAKEKAEEVQKKISEQSEEKLKTLRELVSPARETKKTAEKAENGLIKEITQKGGQLLEKGKTLVKGSVEMVTKTVKEFTDMPPWKRWLV